MQVRRRWFGRRRTLSAQLLAAQILVLVLAGAVGFVLWARAVRGQLDHQYEQRALAIAEATASTPEVIEALRNTDPGPVQAVATAIQHSTGASYVVVIDRFGVRYSHPNSALIGERIEEPVVALDGHWARRHRSRIAGSLGERPSTSVRAGRQHDRGSVGGRARDRRRHRGKG